MFAERLDSSLRMETNSLNTILMQNLLKMGIKLGTHLCVLITLQFDVIFMHNMTSVFLGQSNS